MYFCGLLYNVNYYTNTRCKYDFYMFVFTFFPPIAPPFVLSTMWY